MPVPSVFTTSPPARTPKAAAKGTHTTAQRGTRTTNRSTKSAAKRTATTTNAP